MNVSKPGKGTCPGDKGLDSHTNSFSLWNFEQIVVILGFHLKVASVLSSAHLFKLEWGTKEVVWKGFEVLQIQSDAWLFFF